MDGLAPDEGLSKQKIRCHSWRLLTYLAQLTAECLATKHGMYIPSRSQVSSRSHNEFYIPFLVCLELFLVFKQSDKRLDEYQSQSTDFSRDSAYAPCSIL